MKEASSEQGKATAAAIEYDLLVIGGGIVGTGIARDASMRGLSVVLFEKEDLSCGTSSKSSRLIHGGLRYLQTYDFGLVFKDLHEREVLLRIAPHLIKPLKFVIPNYDPGIKSKSRLWIGMVLYDLLSAGKSLPSHKMLSKQGLLALEPELNPEGLQGGAAFYDCQAAFAERIAVENAISANEHGARIFTHATISGLLKTEGKVCGAKVEDQFSGRSFAFRSKIVVNAAGPWADEILELAQEGHRDVLRKTKGIHIVVPKIATNALAFYAKSDGRLIFAIPWLDNTLVGTTDTDFNADAKDAVAENDEVAYLLKEVATLVRSLKGKAIEFSYAGVRPLVRTSPSKSVSTVSRNYKILDHSSGGQNGLISILGVKLTSYRVAAQDTVDLIE
ncbi:MAG: glycerol-3-phosphate dehydrogenase/oxidase [Nitrososphaerales archaeon]